MKSFFMVVTAIALTAALVVGISSNRSSAEILQSVQKVSDQFDQLRDLVSQTRGTNANFAEKALPAIDGMRRKLFSSDFNGFRSDVGQILSWSLNPEYALSSTRREAVWRSAVDLVDVANDMVVLMIKGGQGFGAGCPGPPTGPIDPVDVPGATCIREVTGTNCRCKWTGNTGPKGDICTVTASPGLCKCP